MKVKVTHSMEQELAERLKKISIKTEIPQSRILASALKERLDQMESTEK